ncbi:MAG: ATP-binding protein [Cytophagales bacterium]|nr:ATP-binding protein [Cytophagales bacterium]
MNKIIHYIDQNLIKVILGQRRVGKSYFMYEIMEVIRQRNPDAPIIYINKELIDFDHIQDYKQLAAYLDAEIKSDAKHYIFIDEIQDIASFEKTLRSLQAHAKHDLYITGSNAFLLSGELSTYLSGRYVEMQLHGLSYQEFIFFHKLEPSNESLMMYLRYGGLPFLVNMPLKDEVVFDYVRNIYEAILFKDVVARHQVRNVVLLGNLVKLLADSTGSVVSAKRISDFLKSQRVEISPNVILNYVGHLEQAFFLNKVTRLEVMGKKQLEIGHKYYFEDLGLRNSLVGYKQVDIGKMMENVVYLHLKIMGYTVYVGKNNEKEIDFVAVQGTEKIYVQVVYMIADESTKEREFGNLLSIRDNYPKYVVTLDVGAGGNVMGVKHVHLLDFVMQRW